MKTTRTFAEGLESALESIDNGRIYLRAIAGARRQGRSDVVARLLEKARKWKTYAVVYLYAAERAVAKQGGAK